MSFLQKLGQFVENVPNRLAEGVEHTKATIEGTLNPNYRHDDPEEKAHDEIRAEINASHRFTSFATERSANFVKWHVDGHDFFYAVSEILDSAKEVIMILDWWLTPELYLRRPPAFNEEWRLDRVLKRKAEEGVKVYIVVYKEVTQTMSMSSHHTKQFLESLHENIAVMRHPDHIGSRDDVMFWSHHEKAVIVDNHRASIGGLDLCFGRWDTHNHPLADAHPTHFAATLFPGQDYNNARLLDFQQVDQFVSNQISILEAPRMPWHDVHMTLIGPVVLDLVQHFVERWNEIKKRKYKIDRRFDWLALPHDVEVAPNESVARHPHREHWHSVGRKFYQRFLVPPGIRHHEPEYPVYDNAPHGGMHVQAVRSVSDWSHGVLTEHSIQNAYIELITGANHYIYIENQFFISNTMDSGVVKNKIAKALVERIIRAAQERQKFHVVVVIPEVPGFAGSITDETSIKTILAAQWRTINRGGDSIYEKIRAAGFDPMDYIRFYHLRAYDRINAPHPSFISRMEENSGVSFFKAQTALARIWLGKHFGHDVNKSVKIKIPQPTSEGLVETADADKNKPQIEEIPMPDTVEEAVDIIRRFQKGADGIRGDEDVSDSVAQHMLGDKTSLQDEKWLGTTEEEKAAYVSELVYIHTKLMVIDDRIVIMGSANLNDRSQKGDGDSEIALVVEDTDEIDSRMNGQPCKATRFAATLRRQLYKEHLGLIPPQNVHGPNMPITSFMKAAPVPNDYVLESPEDEAVTDPLADETIELWRSTAKKNRDIFTEVFRPVPSDLVHNYEAYKNYVPKVKSGHMVPEIPLERAKQRLSEVRGTLVEMPLQFLIEEKELVDNPEWKGLNPTLPVYL